MVLFTWVVLMKHRFRRRIEHHLKNEGRFTSTEINEISTILKNFVSTQDQSVNNTSITSVKIKEYLAKALAELEVKEKNGTIVFYEKQSSWWQRNYPWVIGIISVIVAGLGAYVNWLKAVKP